MSQQNPVIIPDEDDDSFLAKLSEEEKQSLARTTFTHVDIGDIEREYKSTNSCVRDYIGTFNRLCIEKNKQAQADQKLIAELEQQLAKAMGNLLRPGKARSFYKYFFYKMETSKSPVEYLKVFLPFYEIVLANDERSIELRNLRVGKNVDAKVLAEKEKALIAIFSGAGEREELETFIKKSLERLIPLILEARKNTVGPIYIETEYPRAFKRLLQLEDDFGLNAETMSTADVKQYIST